MDLGYGPVGTQIDGGQPRSDGAVGLRRGVVARQCCSYRCVPLHDGPVGHEGIGDGLVHCSGVAVVGQLRIRVIFGLGHGGHQVEGDLGLREVIGQGRRDGVGSLLGRAVSAELGEDPGLAGLREQPISQCQRCVEGGLLHVLQQGIGDLGVHVQRRGPQRHRGVEVAGAGHGQERRGYEL